MKKTFSVLLLSAMAALGANWYVDNAASGSNNGTSWTNAWQSFSAIVWSNVKSGDSINISGGTTSKNYNESIVIGNGGTTDYITIRVGQDINHNGTVIINGGNSRNVGINISGQNYIRISGRVGSGNDCKIQIKNHLIDGIDAENTLRHIVLEYLEIDNNGTVDNSNGIHLQPVFNADLDFEISFCKIHDNYQDGIHAVQNTSGEGTQFGTIRIHDNDIYNFVDDGIETSLPCNIYNNKIHSRIVGAGVGHPDGIQFYNSYTRIYNNDFYDFVRTDDVSANSAIFSDAFDPDITLNPHHIYIYNNLITETNMPVANEYYRGIAIKLAESGVVGGHDIIIANNTIVGVPFNAITFTTNSISHGAISNIQFLNNVFKDNSRSGWGYDVVSFGNGDGTITYGSVGDGADVTVDYNAFFRSSTTFSNRIDYNNNIEQTFSQFRVTSGCQDHYQETDPLLDAGYKPTSSSPLIDHGVNLFAYFTTDKNGVARPQGAGWDIGAYEYVAGTAVAPHVPNRQVLSPTTVRLHDANLTIALPSSIRSPELTVVDLSGREVYHVALNAASRNAGDGGGVVYNCSWYKSLTAGTYFAVIKKSSRNDGAILARTKFVIRK